MIDLAQAFGARVVCYYFDSALSKCLARNQLRQGRARVPDAALQVTFRRLERPTQEEGFHEVYTVKALFDEMFLVQRHSEETHEINQRQLAGVG